MRKVLVCIAALGLLVASCSKTNEETELRNSTSNTGVTPPACDTVNMKFAANIQPIFNANCVSCHNNVISNLGVRLDTYDGVKQQATRVRNNLSVLLGVITHASGFTPMPYNRPKLSDCDINKIKAWINRNSPNN
jgi:hypothetical protein